VRWGIFIFTSEGTVSVHSTSPTQGVGVFKATSSNTASYSLIEQNFTDAVWDGNAQVHAQQLTFSSNGQTFYGTSEAWKLDTQGNVQVKLMLKLEGTRVTLTTPDKLPKQTV